MTSPLPSWSLRAEQPGDGPAIDALTERCFGPGRFAKAAYRLREGVDALPELAFVAVTDTHVLGSIRFWPVTVGRESSLLLGPLVVETALRGFGIGIALMHAGIDMARSRGHGSIILIGDEPYYVRVGFTRIAPGKIRFPGPADPARILGLSLRPNVLLTLSGDVRRARIDHAVCACGAGTAS